MASSTVLRRELQGPLPNADVPVLALGGGVTLTAVLRLLREAGIPAYAVCPSKDFARRSRWYRVLPGDWEHFSSSQLPDLLAAVPLKRAVLIPCSDDWATAVASLPEKMAERFPACTSSLATVTVMADKWLFAELLDRQGVPHPRTRLITSRVDFDALAEEEFRGALLKPISSLEFAFKYGTKGHLVESREQALQIMSGLEFPILLQEFISGPPDAGYFLEGFVDQQRQICALMGRRRLRMYPMGLGNSSFTLSIPLEEIAAVDSLRDLLRAVRYRGIFNAEFKRDARDGQFKLLEVNARAWWYVGFAGRCGVNMCRMAYQDALGLPVQPVTTYETGRRCFFLANELRGWKEGRRNGGMSLWPLIRSWYRADEALFRWDDPAPALVHLAQQMWPGLARSQRNRRLLRPVGENSPSNGGTG